MYGDGDGNGDSMFLTVAKDPLVLEPNSFSAPFIDAERSSEANFSSRKEKLRG
jgi:hypothetical protein